MIAEMWPSEHDGILSMRSMKNYTGEVYPNSRSQTISFPNRLPIEMGIIHSWASKAFISVLVNYLFIYENLARFQDRICLWFLQVFILFVFKVLLVYSWFNSSPLVPHICVNEWGQHWLYISKTSYAKGRPRCPGGDELTHFVFSCFQ